VRSRKVGKARFGTLLHSGYPLFYKVFPLTREVHVVDVRHCHRRPPKLLSSAAASADAKEGSLEGSAGRALKDSVHRATQMHQEASRNHVNPEIQTRQEVSRSRVNPVNQEIRMLRAMKKAAINLVAESTATGKEMRTAPLWGLRTQPAYLHDGRAATIEDAILAHEGQGKKSRELFRKLAKRKRQDVLEFLGSL